MQDTLRDDGWCGFPSGTCVSDVPEFVETAYMSLIILPCGEFDITVNYGFEAFEHGLKKPQESQVMETLHSVLVLDSREYEAMRREVKPSKDKPFATPFSRPFEWWTERLAGFVRNWIIQRRAMEYQIVAMEEGEDDKYNEEQVDFWKAQIQLLDFLLEPILEGKEIPPFVPDLPQEEDEEDDQEDNASENGTKMTVRRRRELEKEQRDKLVEEDDKRINLIMPFTDEEGYLALTPLKRLFILRSLITYRASGFPNKRIYNYLRDDVDQEDIRLEPIAIDHEGRRYYYFHHFVNDCRIYRETPANDEKSAIENEKRYQKVMEDLSKEQDDEDQGKDDQEDDDEDMEDDEVYEQSKAATKAEKKRKKEKEAAAAKAKAAAAAAKKKKSKAETAKQKKNKEEEDRKLAEQLDAGIRKSRRQRSAPQRYDQEQSRLHKMDERLLEEELDELDEDEEEEVRSRSSKSKSKSKKSKKKGGNASKQKQPVAKFVCNGPEMRPAKWELLVKNAEELRAMIDDIKSKRNPHNSFLVQALTESLETYEAVQEEYQAKLAEERKRLAKQMALQELAMPRKRSSRISRLNAERLIREQQQDEEEEEEERIRKENMNIRVSSRKRRADSDELFKLEFENGQMRTTRQRGNLFTDENIKEEKEEQPLKQEQPGQPSEQQPEQQQSMEVDEQPEQQQTVQVHEQPPAPTEANQQQTIQVNQQPLVPTEANDQQPKKEAIDQQPSQDVHLHNGQQQQQHQSTQQVGQQGIPTVMQQQEGKVNGEFHQ